VLCGNPQTSLANFGSYERWREAKDGIFLPRIQGVMDFLLPHAENNPDLADWMASHEKILDRALRAVASIYADDAVALEKKILNMIGMADDAWARPGTLSQRAIRALVSTAGVSTVLVGMRKEAYVMTCWPNSAIRLSRRIVPWHGLA
jgi:hypothetical protein